ncbi:MAG: YCF48-related protein [Bacteroidales bacterium]
MPGHILLGVDFLNSDFGIATGDYGHVLTTTDGGDTWTLTQPFNDQLLHVAHIWDQDSIWICGTPELLYKTTDGGITGAQPTMETGRKLSTGNFYG